ncbi:MAG: FmdE family protein [Methanobacterium sp.]|jgi:formylmethanofuran dehydrogenase subunit E-like metal-binding protein|nr:hypothetical protein [Methanobacterium sp.]
MRKQGVILIFAVLFALILCGAASAADSSSAGGDCNGNVSNAEAIDPILLVNVGYEYANDKINPEFKVTDSTNKNVVFDKVKLNENWKLNFTVAGVSNGTSFNVIVSAPGYITQTQQVKVYQGGSDPNFYGTATFDMKATKNYKLGREVTAKADKLLGLSGAKASDVLVITTAGITKRDGTTTEDCIEGVLNGLGGKVTFGQGNLLILRKSSTDPVDFAFIKKNGNSIQAVFFLKGSTTPVYQGTISQDMKVAQWNNLVKKVGGTNAFTYTSLANAWKAGAPADLLREAAFHGHMCQGTISGYAIAHVLLDYYPPVKDTQNPGSPYDVSAYKIIGVPGDSDDDALINFLNTTPGKGGYAGYDTTSSGATANMVAFIRWVETTQTGDLIIMKFNKKELQQQYKALGNTLKNDLDELKFNTWLLSLIKNKQYMQLVSFVRELKGLNEEQYYTLVGTAGDIKNKDGSVRISAREAKGLDLAYIDSLGLAKATRNIPSNTQLGTLTPAEIKQIGTNAAKLAKNIFLNEKGITLEKDCKNLVVQTSASYALLNGQITDMAMDGVYEELGSRLSRKTLLPMHVAPWKMLYFCFTLRGADGETMNSLYMTYNLATKSFLVGNGSDGKKVNDIGPKALNNVTQLNNIKKAFAVGEFFGNIQSIANAWRVNPRYDQLVTFLFHDHACPGVQPGFFITDMVLKDFPLGPNEEYFYMASSIYCKDDSLVYLMGVSPGMGSYMNQRLINEDTASDIIPGARMEGVLVVWDKKNNIGRAVIVNFLSPTLDSSGLITSEAQRESMIHYYVNAYNGLPYDRMIKSYSQTTTDSRWITAEEFAIIKQGGLASGTALDYVKSIPADRTRNDLIKIPGKSNGGSNSQGTSSNGGITSAIGPGATGYVGSVGDSGVNVSAASETTTSADSEAGDAGKSGKSYEVTKAGAQGTDNTPWGTYAVVGVLSVLALAGIGFFFRGSLFGE